MFYLHLRGPHPATLFPTNTDPFNSPIPSFFFWLVYPVSTPLPVFFTLLSHSSSSKRHKHAHTRAHKALILSLCGFSFKTESSQRKKVTPPPLLRAAGKLQPSSMPHPPLFSLFLSLALSHSHTFAHSVQGQEATGHALTTHKGRRREKEAGEKSENIRPSLQIYRRVNTPETTFAPSLWACGPATPPPAVAMCNNQEDGALSPPRVFRQTTGGVFVHLSIPAENNRSSRTD